MNPDTAAPYWNALLSDVAKRDELLPLIERLARENTAPTAIAFGTSGWRGEIGSDFTFTNVRTVTAAVIETFQSRETALLNALGIHSFNEAKRKGVIVGHDNRFLGRDLALEVIGLLQQAGFRTWYAGEAPTPMLSAAVEMLGAACSINLTPSHNPANYGGLKFNLADGGPAGSEISTVVEGIANEMMRSGRRPKPAEPKTFEEINIAPLYIAFLDQRKTVDLQIIRNFVQRASCTICIDHCHGATRRQLGALLGESPCVVRLRTDDDPLFGGIAPEPSAQNMAEVEKVLGGRSSAFRLGVFMDPDGDRIRHADQAMNIPMNFFGAMALHFLHAYKGIGGILVKSMGASDLAATIARRLGIPVKETKVGVKHFRPYLLRSSAERAIVAFEESDGITAYNHTLEKDAIFGLLLAIEMVALTGKNLSAYLNELMDEFGYCYPDRSGIAIDGSSMGSPLRQRVNNLSEKYPAGATVIIGGHPRTVRETVTIDGTKIVFEDGSWLMIRLSGTEPKVRFYLESRTAEDRTELFEAARNIALACLG